MADKTYDLNVAKGSSWLNREVYQSIKSEVSQWPQWKQAAYGIDNDGTRGRNAPSNRG